MTDDRFIEAMLGWLNRRLAPAGVAIEADTELFAGGLIDSLRVLELIAWTERETGRTIPDRMVRMDHFRTPRRIADVFARSGEPRDLARPARTELGGRGPASARVEGVWRDGTSPSRD